jgi:hypothetical protein
MVGMLTMLDGERPTAPVLMPGIAANNPRRPSNWIPLHGVEATAHPARSKGLAAPTVKRRRVWTLCEYWIHPARADT